MQANNVAKLVGGIFLGCGVILMGVGGWTGNRQYTIVKSWPTVTATVTKSEVTHSTSHGSDRRTNTTMYQTEIEFRYTLNGKEYLTPASSNYSSSSYPEMKRKADAFPPGSTRSIRYNPSDPNDIRFDAALTPGFFLITLITGGLGVVFTLVGGLVFKLSGPAQRAVCPSCGDTVEPGKNFCATCGRQLPSS